MTTALIQSKYHNIVADNAGMTRAGPKQVWESREKLTTAQETSRQRETMRTLFIFAFRLFRTFSKKLGWSFFRCFPVDPLTRVVNVEVVVWGFPDKFIVISLGNESAILPLTEIGLQANSRLLYTLLLNI